MDKSYLKQIKNKNLEAILLSKDNIPVVEHLLSIESQELQRLKKLKEEGKLDFGKKYSRKQLKELFPMVKGKVDNFLNVNNISNPRVDYFSITSPESLFFGPGFGFYGGVILIGGGFGFKETYFLQAGVLAIINGVLHTYLKNTDHYNHLFKNITLRYEERSKIIPTLGHEYTHHIQKISGIKSVRNHSIFQEGHARGIERYISNLFRESEDNEAFLYHITNLNARELKNVYKWLCEKTNLTPNEALLKVKGIYDTKFLDNHAKGNVLFYIQETKKGPQVYNDAIHGNLVFN
ncbi:MAG TPA: hypothetical protein VJJ23_05065 [Candidatus Nanoarchaeia archaeon]|nr:hypothetical protein [Candidatus Nanoarchaeia archaeon]